MENRQQHFHHISQKVETLSKQNRNYCMCMEKMCTLALAAWWPKINQKMGATALNQTRCLPFIGMTGAMKPCPLNAIEAVLGLTRLFIAIENKVCLSALTLSNIGKLKPENFRGHLDVLKNFMEKSFVKILDHCVVKLAMSHRFGVIIPDHTELEWANPWRTQGNGKLKVQNFKMANLRLVFVSGVFRRPY